MESHVNDIVERRMAEVVEPPLGQPLVSVLIPCRQESRHIDACLRDVLAQQSPNGGFEVLVIDGMSVDGTREKVAELARRDNRLRLLENPEQTVPHGMNMGIREARGEIVVRMDVHTRYAADYLSECVAVLNETGADNVGGPARVEAHGYVARAIAAAYQSRFTVGNARFHFADYEGPVDSVVYGCWRRQTLLEIGLFDEELVRNQDDELNYRMVRAGKRLWQSRRIRSYYHPRDSLRKLFRQYYQYGFWKVRVMQKHGRPASLRHILPAALVGGLMVGLIAALAFPALAWIYFIPLAVYGAVLVVGTIDSARRGGWDLIPILPAVIACYHWSYGFGTLSGFWHFVVCGRRGDQARRQRTLSR